jgi:hypothetical protein
MSVSKEDLKRLLNAFHVKKKITELVEINTKLKEEIEEKTCILFDITLEIETLKTQLKKHTLCPSSEVIEEEDVVVDEKLPGDVLPDVGDNMYIRDRMNIARNQIK